MIRGTSGYIANRKPSDGRRRESGAVLVVAILVLLVASILTISGANQTVLGERLASNKYKQTQSFLAAEAGISKAREIAKSEDVRAAVVNGSDDAINAAFASQTGTAPQYVSVAGSKPTYELSGLQADQQYWNKTTREFEVLSTGRVAAQTNNQSQRMIGVRIAVAYDGNTDPTASFDSAIVVRNDVSLSGSAKIDSFNSDYGRQGAEVAVEGDRFNNDSSVNDSAYLDDVRLTTCDANATVNLSGQSPIYGDVLSTGDIIANGQTPIYGDIRANGRATFNGHVYGDITAQGDITLGSAAIVEHDVRGGKNLFSRGIVKGTITVAGNITYQGNSSTTGGVVTAGGNVVVDGTGNRPSVIRAGGSITVPSYVKTGPSYEQDLPKSELGITEIPPVQPTSPECSFEQLRDPTSGELGERFATVLSDPRTVPLTDWLDSHGCAFGYNGQEHCYQQNGASLTLRGNSYQGIQPIGADNTETLLNYSGNLTSAGALQILDIKGYVTLLIDGDFNLLGQTSLRIEPNSTLTLLVTGKAQLSAGTELVADGQFVRNGADGKPRPAVALYSAYQAGDASVAGVIIGGANKSTITIYAPETRVRINGSGDIYGAVVANALDMSGAGNIHYDEALKKISSSSGSASTGKGFSTKLAGWWQVAVS